MKAGGRLSSLPPSGGLQRYRVAGEGAVAEIKRVLVLAHSIKHWPGMCVAGREILLRSGRCYLGDWIRPVSWHGDGELWAKECALPSGRPPRVMDIVEIPLASHLEDPTQPENWRIVNHGKWQAAGPAYRKPPRELLLEDPPSLWRQKGQRSDRVTCEFLETNPVDQSLYLVEVEDLRVRFAWEDYEDRSKQRYRALFTYKASSYEFNITDPQFTERHRAKFPRQGDPAHTFAVNAGKPTILCISLARAFNGHHFKVAATIFE